jgi:hypothetical protein
LNEDLTTPIRVTPDKPVLSNKIRLIRRKKNKKYEIDKAAMDSMIREFD